VRKRHREDAVRASRRTDRRAGQAGQRDGLTAASHTFQDARTRPTPRAGLQNHAVAEEAIDLERGGAAAEAGGQQHVVGAHVGLVGAHNGGGALRAADTRQSGFVRCGSATRHPVQRAIRCNAPSNLEISRGCDAMPRR
jgi:hypothetical protein